MILILNTWTRPNILKIDAYEVSKSKLSREHTHACRRRVAMRVAILHYSKKPSLQQLGFCFSFVLYFNIKSSSSRRLRKSRPIACCCSCCLPFLRRFIITNQASLLCQCKLSLDYELPWPHCRLPRAGHFPLDISLDIFPSQNWKPRTFFLPSPAQFP